jgi:hypothetical protein
VVIANGRGVPFEALAPGLRSGRAGAGAPLPGCTQVVR